MTHIPQIPRCDNPRDYAMHAANIRYYEQNQFNPKLETLHAAGTAIGVQFVVGFIVLVAAVLFLVPQ